MAYIICEPCVGTKDTVCVDVCPVDCIHPRKDEETAERIKLLTTENAQLRAEIGSMKDRLETVERIVTDQPSRLAHEIDRLAIDKGGNA